MYKIFWGKPINQPRKQKMLPITESIVTFLRTDYNGATFIICEISRIRSFGNVSTPLERNVEHMNQKNERKKDHQLKEKTTN